MDAYQKVLNLWRCGDLILAERAARQLVYAQPADVQALRVYSSIALEMGMVDEALENLKKASISTPEDFPTQYNLGAVYFQKKDFRSALAHFERAARLEGGDKLRARVQMALCNALLGSEERVYADLAVVSPALAKAWNGIGAGGAPPDLTDLDSFHLHTLKNLTQARGHRRATAEVVNELWRRKDPDITGADIALVVGDLQRRGAATEAANLYLESLTRGFPVFDYRPRHDAAAFGSGEDSQIAVDLRDDDREAYLKSLSEKNKPSFWAPIFSQGNTELRAIVPTGAEAAVFFELTGDASKRKLEAVVTSSFCSATIPDLLPGKSYTGRVAVLFDGHELTSDPVIFTTPAFTTTNTSLAQPDIIGVGGVALSGVAAAQSSGVRYWFEYGAMADDLTLRTQERALPPPRTGRVRDKAERMVNHWTPRSTQAGWVTATDVPDVTIGPPRRWAMHLVGPFAKDRNQLNGVGSHEMPLNWCWCYPWERNFLLPHKDRTLSVGGGVMDLRDAEFNFTIRSHGLTLEGSALTFWMLIAAEDHLGKYASQWALTGDPFPDEIFAAEDRWHKVKVALPNDPRAWTYTGNNPKEQGLRANRYRRLPLHDTISRNDGQFVVIFVYGEERRPPNGAFSVYEISAAYRDHSALSQAAGAKLIAWPGGSVCDPLCLTSGARGYDEELWTSGPAPAYPLEFEWSLPNPVAVRFIQLNQHPHCPAKDVEILGRSSNDGAWRVLWRGVMTDSVRDFKNPNYSAVKLDPSPCVGLRLRILSGHADDYCGLDGIEVYGDGAVFTGDGKPCTISEEISGLEPGSTVYFRLAVEEPEFGEITYSETASITIPTSPTPILYSAEPKTRRKDPRCIVIRGNAMGLESELVSELQLASGGVVAGPKVYFGRQPTGRHIYYNLPDNFPEDAGTFRLTLRNTFGDTTMDIAWPPAWTMLP